MLLGRMLRKVDFIKEYLKKVRKLQLKKTLSKVLGLS